MQDLKCQLPDNNPPDDAIRKVLQRSRKIAVVGLSPKEERDSNMVARYLLEQGYEIVPVNPGQKEILGRESFASLNDIPFPVDMANLFLNPKRIAAVVDQSMEKGVNVIWMQLGIVDNESAEKARQRGITVIMDRCIKQEYEKLFGRKG